MTTIALTNIVNDKFQFVATTHLAHDFPISHTITPISHAISKSVGMGFLLQTVENRLDEHEWRDNLNSNSCARS